MPAPGSVSTHITRQWGDGGGPNVALAEHRIGAIGYPRVGPSWITCSCFMHLVAATPEALAFLWLDHGGQVLTFSAEDRHPTVVDPGRSLRAMAAIVMMVAQCTCTPDSDVRECPNFMEGDEREDQDDAATSA